jgi:YVTN family beta-propeller protein
MSGGTWRGTIRRTASFLFVGVLSCGGNGTASTGEGSAATSPGISQVEILRHMPTGAAPIGITAAFGSVWVVNSEFRVHDRGSVTRIDPDTGKVVATITVGSVLLEVAPGAGALWVSNSGENTVSRIDPSSNEVVATVDVCHAPGGLAAAGTTVWVACEDDDAVGVIDATHDRMVSTTDVGISPRFVLAAYGSIWVSNDVGSTISRIDPGSGRSSRRSTPRPGRN